MRNQRLDHRLLVFVGGQKFRARSLSRTAQLAKQIDFPIGAIESAPRRLDGGTDAITCEGSRRIQVREQLGPGRLQLAFGLQHPLCGDADVVIGFQRFFNEVTKRRVPEEVEPLGLAQ